jgi:hypothetical protein
VPALTTDIHRPWGLEADLHCMQRTRQHPIRRQALTTAAIASTQIGLGLPLHAAPTCGGGGRGTSHRAFRVRQYRHTRVPLTTAVAGGYTYSFRLAPGRSLTRALPGPHPRSPSTCTPRSLSINISRPRPPLIPPTQRDSVRATSHSRRLAVH